MTSSGTGENRTPDILIANQALYQLSYGPEPSRGRTAGQCFGVNDGARTRDIRLHKPALYQLSYAHQADPERSSG